MDVGHWTGASGWILLPLFLLLALGCSSDEGTPISQDGLDRPPDPPTELSDELTSNLFDWPATEFGRGNAATIEISRLEGDVAVEFTLADLDGNEWTLSELLRSGPVLLLPGSYTCPVYQAVIPRLNELFVEWLPDGRRFGEAVHFVHVYIVEAHPQLPDPTPYRNWTDSDLPVGGEDGQDTFAYGVVGQAYTYAERIANARRLGDRIYGDQLRLIDDLTPHGPNNPIWCTYGTAPNAGFLIAQDGTIAAAHLWVNVSKMRRAILEQLGFTE